MINKDNFPELLVKLGFIKHAGLYTKDVNGTLLQIDVTKQVITYPEAQGLVINERQTCNFLQPENFVVFECVHRLLEKGYKPEHIELEPRFKVGHGASGGRADILVRNQQNQVLLIIECKIFGTEFNRAWKDTQQDGGQLFTYIEQEKATEFICLYASDFDVKAQSLTIEQRIISHKDNPKILSDDPTLKPFKEANNLKERFKVWRDTYQLEFTEKGIFEENIQAYQIGKDKYTLTIDTKPIDAADKKGKYHQFRTILRKYNVSRRENAFEVLVNLFLCKIVDETEHPDNLKFYWKGIAYDNHYDLVDRLQELYKTGMERFLGQQITYISNQQIDDAFWAFKQKRNATKHEIKEIFRSLKFFNDNAFGLIAVTNKETFAKNAKILLELIQMWQGLRLKTEEQNQFLGDMFEYFLDNGIKQSEGQFFTPVPICKFIVSSLPLENQLQNKSEPLNAIDYACGSGHFLTEYALQIKPLVAKHKHAQPADYYRHTIGIEKEDRLAKVAKISAFMYGLDEIKILDADALAQNAAIQNENFDVLVANPPFAVEDFLMTLAEADREQYSLLEAVSDVGNRNIQCFFLERAKQLLAGNGVAGIVVPSSVLSNADAMHIQTREILLKYFDIVSIAELGSNTFGKTGTNTVVLFLRRKAQRPEPAEHYWNRTLDFFENWAEEQALGGGAYQDLNLVRNYCQHINIGFDDYQSLLTGTPSADLLATELFNDYQAEFNKQTEIKKLKQSAPFRAKTDQAQQAELAKRLIAYLQQVEQQKLYYFMLTASQPHPVLVIKSPSDNTAQKQFLGYEWGGAKGSEGIKYNGGDTVYDVITPMFDPNNTQNPNKINYYIQQNFMGLPVNIPAPLQGIMSQAPLANLLDFSRRDFNKAIGLTVKKHDVVASKWGLVKLGDECSLITKGTTPTSIGFQFVTNGINFVKIESIYLNGQIDKTKFAYITTECHQKLSRSSLVNNDILFSIAGALGRATIITEDILPANINQALAIIRLKPSTQFLVNYVYLVLSSDLIQNQIDGLKIGIAQPNLSLAQMSDFKIPLPPLDIQQQIVTECEAIDQAANDAQTVIQTSNAKMVDIVNNTFATGTVKKLKALLNINELTKDPTLEPEKEFIYVDIESVGKGTGAINYEQKILGKNAPSRARRVAPKNSTIISTVRPNLKGFAFIENEVEAIYSTGFAILQTKKESALHSKVIYYLFMYSSNLMGKMESTMHGGSYPSLNKTDIENFEIPVPPLAIQTQLVAEIEQLEQRIAENRTVIDQASSLKQAVMQKYL